VLWDLTSIPPQFAGIDHFCVIVEITGDGCATYDNRAQNNFGNVPTVGPSPAPISMYIKNPWPMLATGQVLIEPDPAGWKVNANVPDLSAIALAPGEEKLITVELSYQGKCQVTDREAAMMAAKVPAQIAGICAKEQFDLSFALDGNVLGGVSSAVIVHPPTVNWPWWLLLVLIILTLLILLWRMLRT